MRCTWFTLMLMACLLRYHNEYEECSGAFHSADTHRAHKEFDAKVQARREEHNRRRQAHQPHGSFRNATKAISQKAPHNVRRAAAFTHPASAPSFLIVQHFTARICRCMSNDLWGSVRFQIELTLLPRVCGLTVRARV